MKYISTLCLFLFLNTVSFGQFKEKPISKGEGFDIKEIKVKNKKLNHTKDKWDEQVPADYNLTQDYYLPSAQQDFFRVKSWNRGRPVFIEGSLKQGRSFSSIEAQSKAYLDGVSKILSIKNADEEFELVEIQEDDLDMVHLKYRQTYNGIPVWGAEFILHAKDGLIQKSNGLTFPTIPYQIPNEVLSIEEIKNKITSQIPLKQLTPAQKRFMPDTWKIDQVIYHLDENFNNPILAYHVEYRPNIFDRWFLIINAENGEELEKYSGVCKFHNHNIEMGHSANAKIMPPDGPAVAMNQDLLNVTRTINTYESNNQFFMMDAVRPMFSMSPNGIFESEGLIVTLDAQNTSPENNSFDYRDVTSSNNNWSDKTAVSAHYNAGEAYEYFRTTHNRNSINGNGGNILSLIHVADSNGGGMDNAFWNGAAMWYGDGNQAFKPLARGLDVAGHEISHGVVQSTANLAYQGESGALNESFADVFGAMIDRDDWQMGEDVVETQFFPSGALRDLEDPHNGASPGDYQGGFQPKHTNEQFTGPEDNGGVHINSGIPNHAFYLFAESVGKEKAEDVWYRALNNYLTASSQFIDLRLATLSAADDLNLTNNEKQSLRSAMDMVGILDGEGGSYQNDTSTNDGGDFLVMTDIQGQDVYIADLSTGDTQKISDKDPMSKPSISDDGTFIVFVGTDRLLHAIYLEWSGNQLMSINEDVLESSAIWRNIVTSRDGRRLAGLFDNLDNRIWVYDFDLEEDNIYELYDNLFGWQYYR